MPLKRFFWAIVMTSLSILVFAQTYQKDQYLYFDLMIEYQYSNPYDKNGRLLVRFNSVDEIAMYQFFDDEQLVDTVILIGFKDGSSIYGIINPYDEKYSFFPRSINSPRYQLFQSMEEMKKYLKPSSRKEEIAGFETQLYQGVCKDGTFRKMWFLEEAFESKTIHQFYEITSVKLPLPLTEGGFVSDRHMLMKSQIYQDNTLLHELEVVYLEYDFFRYEIVDEVVWNSLTYQLGKNPSLGLYLQYKSIWEQYDTMSGIQYTPQEYQFTQCATYSWSTGEDTKSFNCFFDPSHSVVKVELNQDEVLLAFQNRQFHYYTYNDDHELLCFVYKNLTSLPDMDDLHYISASSDFFHSIWEKSQTDKQGHIAYKKQSSHSQSTEELILRQVDFDPRAIHGGVHLLHPDFPSFLQLITPPYHLLVSWANFEKGNQTLNIKLIDLKKCKIHFDDRPTVRFIKLY